ncbi:MAG: type II secretion system F family protein [Firmicutes bacterium]|nr:type II secretion system F family protein [Bacillota bacterium]
MPLYNYKAYGADGKIQKGLIDAPSRNSAFGKLKRQGVYPIDLEEEAASNRQGRVSSTDLIFALEQLSTLLKANVPLPEALTSLFEQLENRELKKAFARVKVHLEEGSSFANSLAMERIFPTVLVKMVEAGESVGSVDLILERFADFMDKQNQFKEKVTSSMVYPVLIMCASFGLIFFILTYIGPTLVDVFKSFGRELPMPTQILLTVGTFLKKNTILIALLIAGAIYCWVKVLPRHLKDTIMMKLPLFGNINTNVQVSRWARTLSMLHGGGVTLVKALASSREVVDNSILESELKKAEEYIHKGDTLGNALSRIPIMPHLVVQMAKTGEKSGELERLLNTAALFYEKEVDKKLSMFFKLLEPAIIMFLGVVVGFVVVSALLPILEINKLIR